MKLVVLLLAAAAAAGNGLSAAEAAFARGEYPEAERLALAAARPPRTGAALYLAGLARFRSGHPAAALTALDAAGRSADPPPSALWQFNRGACLYELGRMEEAEAAFLAAAADRSLAPTALAQAGFAALGAGAPDRARALAARARPLATGAALGLLADLEAELAAEGGAAPARRAATEHQAGIAAYDAGDFAEALARFRRSAELDPGSGQSRIMAGAAAWRLGSREEARTELRSALALPLDAGDARVARDYLEQVAPGLASRGEGWELGARAGGGADDNVRQSGSAGALEFAPVDSGKLSSGFATAGAGLARRWRTGEQAFAEVTWRLDQLAYAADAAADYSLQQQALTAALEVSVSDRLRVGALAGGNAAFTGLSRFRLLQGGGSGAAWLELDLGAAGTSRLGLGLSGKATRPEFGYLQGWRAEASVSHAQRLGALSLEGSYHFRLERLGWLTQATHLPLPRDLCMLGCLDQRYRVPFGYASHALSLSAGASLGSQLRAGAAAGLEWRDYLEQSVLLVKLGDGSERRLDAKTRHDLRPFGTLLGTWRPRQALELTLRYDLLVSRSNVGGRAAPAGCGLPGGSCSELDYGDKRFTKQVLTLEAGLTW